MLKRAAQILLDTVYPPQCLLCRDLVLDEGGLCGKCWRDTPFIFQTICDLCGAPLPGEARDWAAYCDDCLHSGGRAWVQGRAAMLYSGNAPRLVMALKHGDRMALAWHFGHWMRRAAGRMLGPECLLVPVPLHWSRMVKRRYNQSALLAQAIGKQANLPVALDALLRSRATPALDGAGRRARAETLSGAICPHPRHGAKLMGREVVLIDDVMTSGATLTQAALAARAAGAKRVCVLVLARVAKEP